MKLQILSIIIAMVSLTACASCTTENDGPIKGKPETENPDSSTGVKGKTLVAYFSCTNTTKDVAESIADITGGDLFRIEPEKPYSQADLDYNSDCRANREQNDPSARPSIKGKCENLADYDVVFLGYPIWWGEAPRIISSRQK